MDIACPSCAATYRIPEALLARGKPLRCVACGEAWVPETPAPPSAPEAMASLGPEAIPSPRPDPALPQPPSVPPFGPPEAGSVAAASIPARIASPLTPPRRNGPLLQGRGARQPDLQPGAWLRLAWAASIATVLSALAGLVLYGHAIADAWPPFARVTALLGG